MRPEVKPTGFDTCPWCWRISEMIFWKARYLSKSAVVGRPYLAEGNMVAWASTTRPFISRRNRTIFSVFTTVLRDFAGEKKPRVFRFFSTLTKSGGTCGMLTTATEVPATGFVISFLG